MSAVADAAGEQWQAPCQQGNISQNQCLVARRRAIVNGITVRIVANRRHWVSGCARKPLCRAGLAGVAVPRHPGHAKSLHFVTLRVPGPLPTLLPVYLRTHRLVSMPSPSFRQYLLLAFLLIVAVLTAAAMQGLSVLEDFASRSRGAAGDALRLSRVVQLLGERAVDMTRSARQYRLLGEPALFERFVASRTEAVEAIDGLDGLVTIDLTSIQPSLADWRASAGRVEGILTAAGEEAALFAELNRLAAIAGVVSGAAREAIEAHNQTLFDALDANRALVASQVSAAVLVSVVLAIAF